MRFFNSRSNWWLVATLVAVLAVSACVPGGFGAPRGPQPAPAPQPAPGQVVISTPSIDETVGQAISGQLQASGGNTPYRWSADLPQGSGVSVADDGKITGTPAGPFQGTVKVKVTDSSSPRLTAEKDVPVTIRQTAAAPAPQPPAQPAPSPAPAAPQPAQPAIPPAQVDCNVNGTVVKVNSQVDCDKLKEAAKPPAAAPQQPPSQPQPTPAVVPPAKPGQGGMVQTTPVPGFRTPYTGPATSQPDPVQAERAHIGQNIWRGVQLDLSQLSALGQNEWYLAHGDVAGNGKCAVWYWTTAKPKPGELSNATWQLYKLAGPSVEALMDAVSVEQQIAGGHADCPSTKKN